jgi:hypothetical protein
MSTIYKLTELFQKNLQEIRNNLIDCVVVHIFDNTSLNCGEITHVYNIDESYTLQKHDITLNIEGDVIVKTVSLDGDEIEILEQYLYLNLFTNEGSLSYKIDLGDCMDYCNFLTKEYSIPEFSLL